MQLPWKHERIRLKNTRADAPPTSSRLKDGDDFTTWLAEYCECLERIRNGTEPSGKESTERKGTK